MAYAESDGFVQRRLTGFKERLAARGWKEGHNLRIDVRWTGGDVRRATALAKEIVALKPDVILTTTTPVTAAMRSEAGDVPIVFVAIADPVGSGFVNSLSRPGGTLTGITNLESSLHEKSLQLLKEIAPRVKRVSVMFNRKTAPYANYYLEPLNAAAPQLGVEASTTPVENESDIDRVVTELGSKPVGGLLCLNDAFNMVHRKTIIALAAQHKVPAIYVSARHVEDGGLMSYGIDLVDEFRRVATYVDRILRGAKPQDLPVEKPTKFELAINRKTARALGLAIPQSLLTRADRVIE